MNAATGYLRDHPDTTHVEYLLPDINGVLRGKRLPATALPKLYAGQLQLPRATVLLDTLGHASTRTPYGVRDGDPDRALLPVPGSLTPAGIARPGVAQVLTLMSDEPGKPWFANSRTVLERCVRAFDALSVRPVVAIELEFYLLRVVNESVEALQSASRRAGFQGPQTYNPDVLDEFAALFADIDASCELMNLPTGSVLSEFGDGQFEINLHHHDDLPRACDEALLLKRAIRQCALKHGYLPSFMAKPLPGESGNGLHVHLSLVDDNDNNMFGSRSSRQTGSEIDSTADVLDRTLAGLLQLMPQSMAFFAPNANSYRRLDPGSFAPCIADWGDDHRAVAIRIPRSSADDRRLEHRVAGADANPHLVMAAVLAGVLHGLSDPLPLDEPTVGDRPCPSAQTLPNRWRSALDALGASDILPRYLGEEFCRLYLTVKEDEESRWHDNAIRLDQRDYLRQL